MIRATRSMSPEKTRVVHLCMELGERNEWCDNIDRLKRLYYQEAKALKQTMKSLEEWRLAGEARPLRSITVTTSCTYTKSRDLAAKTYST